MGLRTPAAGAPPSWRRDCARWWSFGRQPEAAAAGREVHPGQARGRTAPRGTAGPACSRAGGRPAGRRPVRRRSHSCPHPIACSRAGTCSLTKDPAPGAGPTAGRRPVRARRGRDGFRDPARRQGAGLRGVRGPGGLPRAQLPRRAELPPRRRPRPRSRRGQGRAARLPRPPRHRALHLPTGASPDRLAGRRRTTRRRARHRPVRRDGLVGRWPVRRRLRRQDARPRHGRRVALERGAPRPLRHDPRAQRGGPRHSCCWRSGRPGWPPPS